MGSRVRNLAGLQCIGSRVRTAVIIVVFMKTFTFIFVAVVGSL